MAWIWSITFTFSENSNYWRECLLEVIRQNIAGWYQENFENKNVLPLHLKHTFPPIIWIFTEGEGIKSRLPFKVFSTLQTKNYWWRNFKGSFMNQKLRTLNYPLEIVKISCFVLFLEALLVRQAKSFCISRAVSNFSGTEIKINVLVLAQLAIMKKMGRLWAIFEGGFFMFSLAKNIFFCLKIL